MGVKSTPDKCGEFMAESEREDITFTDREKEEIDRHFVATVFVVQNDRLLLLWHNKMQMWLPPGGHIEPGELPDEAAIREVREETGLEVLLLPVEERRYNRVAVLHRPFLVQLEDIAPGHQHMDLIYLATPIGGNLCCNQDEAAQLRWFDAETLADGEISPAVRDFGREAIVAVRGSLTDISSIEKT